MKKIKRNKTSTMTSLLPLIFFVLVSFLLSYLLIQNNPFVKVKKGSHDLYCNFYVNNGPVDRRKVDPNLVIDLVEGTWVFSNGSARNCELVSKAKDL